MSEVFIISGANGSGKTTIAKQILPHFLGIYEYVNADEIAAGLSPFSAIAFAVGCVTPRAFLLLIMRYATLTHPTVTCAL